MVRPKKLTKPFGRKQKRKSRKSSLRLAGQISQLARMESGNEEVSEAEILAIRGRRLTEMEELIYGFYRDLSEVLKIRAGQKTKAELVSEESNISSVFGSISNLHKYLEKSLNESAAMLSQIFIQALERKDEKKVDEIAKAVKSMKSFEPSGDDTRFAILTWKRIVIRRGEKWPNAKLAKILGRPKSEAQNGYATVRRMAEELNFPLAD